VGVDNAWEQEKPEASLSWPAGQGKMLENAAESHTSGARFVSPLPIFNNGLLNCNTSF
jgi:hypothetical protein